jgi:hypothetical protein
MLAGAALSVPAYPQAVISARSGVVHFFEGSVSVDGQPLAQQLGKFKAIPEGSELRTEQGRAEVLLTPGKFLRVGENSAIRMVASALSDTRVELLAGSAIVSSLDPGPGTSVKLTYKTWSVHQGEKGSYRIDCDPPRVQVLEGKAEVSTDGGAPVAVDQGMALPFAPVLVPERSNADLGDPLSEWSDGRAESISADNAIAANIQDPALLANSSYSPDAFTYFPMLGYPYLGSPISASPYSGYGAYPYGVYGAISPYQAGLNSIYLPGYAHRSLYLGLPGGGFGRSLYSPSRLGIPAGPMRPPTGIRTFTPPAPIVHPAPQPSVPHAPIHVGGRH